MSNFTYNPRSLGALQPFVRNNPTNIISPRSPGVHDQALIGQLWVNTATNGVFILTSIVGGLYNWESLTEGGGTGTFTTLTVTGNATIAGTLGVTGTSSLHNTTVTTLTASGLATFNGNFQITGATSDVDITGNASDATAVNITAPNGGVTISGTSDGVTIPSGLFVENGGVTKLQPAIETSASPTATATFLTGDFIGVATFTGFTTAAAGTQQFIIDDPSITTTTGLLVTVSSLNASLNGARLTINAVVQTSGSFSVYVTNNGAGALGAGDNVLVSFMILSQ